MTGKKIALTFDDGPSAEATPRILSVLKQYGIRATFFMIGIQAEANGDLVRQIREAGHQIGNHTWDHEYINRLEPQELRAVLRRTTDMIVKQGGERPTIFRPPAGEFDKASMQIVGEEGMAVIIWSVDPKDWKRLGADVTVQRVLDNTEAGDVVLMHDIHAQTADAVEIIVPELLRRGFEPVTLAELAADVQIPLTDGEMYRNFHPNKGKCRDSDGE